VAVENYPLSRHGMVLQLYSCLPSILDQSIENYVKPQSINILCHFCKHNCYEVCVTPIYLVDLIPVSYLNYCDILFYLWPKQWVFLVYY